MKKIIILVLIVSMFAGCATLGSQSNDRDYTKKNLQVIEKTFQEHCWDVFKIGLGVVGQAVLLNNYFIHP